MIKRKIAFLFWTAAICVFVLYAAVGASGATPGSEADPVVTKSYVDQKINDAINAAGGLTGSEAAPVSEELLAQIEFAVRQQIQKEQGTVFTPVSVEMGKTIYGGEGCEMILRSGRGHIVTSTDTVINVTTGVDLKNGAPVQKGNLLIFPRDDGRGVKAADACWFIVKGSYVIE